MGKNTFVEVGFLASNAFRAIGNSLNLKRLIQNPKTKITIEVIIRDDKKALLADWRSVSREVEVAFDRFENQYHDNRQLRETTGGYLSAK